MVKNALENQNKNIFQMVKNALENTLSKHIIKTHFKNTFQKHIIKTHYQNTLSKFQNTLSYHISDGQKMHWKRINKCLITPV